LHFPKRISGYEEYITRLGGPDENAQLLMQLLSGSGTLIDVGANIGTISVPVAARGSEVISIEMVPDNCLRLWFARRLNGLTNLHIVQAAASDYDGMIAFAGGEAWANV
jgi:precorrin-6B methylase 2